MKEFGLVTLGYQPWSSGARGAHNFREGCVQYSTSNFPEICGTLLLIPQKREVEQKSLTVYFKIGVQLLMSSNMYCFNVDLKTN